MTESTSLELLQRAVARILNLESADPDIGIVELGVTSLNVVELMLLVEDLYNKPVQLNEVHVDQFTTLRQLDQQLLTVGVHSAESTVPS